MRYEILYGQCYCYKTRIVEKKEKKSKQDVSSLLDQSLRTLVLHLYEA